MTDDVLINKAATIERCVKRAREEYARGPATFATDFTRQDAAILNIQRACEAALDMGQHVIRREKLGLPQGARDVFALLAQGGWIDAGLADGLKRMVGFRNIAVTTTRACSCRSPWPLLKTIWTYFFATAYWFCCATRRHRTHDAEDAPCKA